MDSFMTLNHYFRFITTRSDITVRRNWNSQDFVGKNKATYCGSLFWELEDSNCEAASHLGTKHCGWEEDAEV